MVWKERSQGRGRQHMCIQPQPQSGHWQITGVRVPLSWALHSSTLPLHALGQRLVSFMPLVTSHPLHETFDTTVCFLQPLAFMSSLTLFYIYVFHQHLLPNIPHKLLIYYGPFCIYLPHSLTLPHSSRPRTFVLFTTVSVSFDYVVSNQM